MEHPYLKWMRTGGTPFIQVASSVPSGTWQSSSTIPGISVQIKHLRCQWFCLVGEETQQTWKHMETICFFCNNSIINQSCQGYLISWGYCKIKQCKVLHFADFCRILNGWCPHSFNYKGRTLTP